VNFLLLPGDKIIFKLVENLLPGMNTNQKIYLTAGLAIIIVILLIWGIIRPLVLEIKITSNSVKERNEKLIVLRKTDQEYLRKLESEYNNIRQDISLVGSGFLNTDQIVDFFVDLENMALVTFNKLEIEAGELPSFTLFLLGSFPNLMKFLGWLENTKYFLDVDSVDIKGFSEEKSSLEKEPLSVGDISTVLKIKLHPAPQKNIGIEPKTD